MYIANHGDVACLEEAEVIDHHFHNYSRWFGKKAVQSATAWGVPLDTGLSLLYRAISGNGVYGADANDEAQILGSADTPKTGAVYFDPHEILVVANSSNTLYLNRLVWGTGTLADAVTAGQYSEFAYYRAAADNVRQISRVICPRIAAGTQLWLQTMNATNNATIDFVIGFHTYIA